MLAARPQLRHEFSTALALANRFAGVGEPLPLAERVWGVAVSAVDASVDRVGDIASLAHDVLRSDRRRLLSTVASADAASMDRRRVHAGVQLCVAAAWHVMHWQRWALERWLAYGSAAELVAYVTAQRYDETPLRVRCPGTGARMAPVARSSGLYRPDEEGVADSLVSWTPSLTEKVSSTSSAAKILQSETGVGCLLRLGDLYYAVIAEYQVPLQQLERGTALCMQAALVRGWGATPAATAAYSRVRVAAADQASSNVLVEKALGAETRLGGWTGFHWPCEVHTTARICSSVFSLVEDDIRGLIHHALSLSQGSSLCGFRRALRAEIRSRTIHILQGCPPMAAQRRRDAALQLFAARGGGVVRKRFLLETLANGHWDRDDIDVYIEGDIPSRESVVRTLSNGLVSALTGRGFKIYPRHRWTGADEALDGVGLLQCIHRLGWMTYARWLRLMDAGGHAAEPPSQRGDCEVGGDRCLVLPILDCLPEDTRDGAAAAAVLAGAQAAAPPASSWAAQNAASRRVAGAWWSSEPAHKILVMRIVMEPLREMLASRLHLGGRAWVGHQAESAAAVAKRGAPPKRTWPAQVCASNELEERCLQLTRLLLEDGHQWELIPRVHWTRRTRCLITRMLIRLACRVEKDHMRPHRNFPYCLFPIVGRTQRAEMLLERPVCLRDRLASEFFRIANGDMQNTLALAWLDAVSALVHVDTATIEKNHASIRRWLMMRGHQTHTMGLSSLSAEWTNQQVRLANKAMPRRRAQVADAATDSARQGRGTKRRRGGGGAYRAFVSSALRERGQRLGQPNVAAGLAREYSGLHAAARAAFSSRGSEATRRWRGGHGAPGFSAFGAPRDLRKSKRAARLAHARGVHQRQQALADALGHDGALVPKRAAPCGYIDESFREGLRARRAQYTFDGAVTKADDARRAEELTRWQRAEGQLMLSRLIGAGRSRFPAELMQLDALVVEPSTYVTVIRVPLQTATHAENAVAGLSQRENNNLREAVLEAWQRWHAVIMEEDAPPLNSFDTTPNIQPSECREAGVCLCSLAGRCLKLLRKCFLRALKCWWPFGSDARKRVVAGYAVLHVAREPRGGVEGAPRHAQARAPVPVADDFWLCVGHVRLSPWGLTFATAEPVDGGTIDGPSSSAVDPMARASIKMRYEYFIDLDFLMTLDCEDAWTVALYEMDDSATLVAFMQPTRCDIRRVEPPVQFWPPRGRRRGGGGGPGGGRAVPLRIDDILAPLGDEGAASSDGDGGAREDAGHDGGGSDAEGRVDDEVELLGGYAPMLDEPAEADGLAGPEVFAPPPLVEPEAPPPRPHGPAPVVVEDAAPDAAARRGRADAVMLCTGGTISFYANKNQFTAVCNNGGHGQCVVTRQATLRAKCRGRPLGFMLRWLELGDAAASKDDHWEMISVVEGDQPARQVARRLVEATVEGRALAAFERPRAAGEGDEF